MKCKELKAIKANYNALITGMTPEQSDAFKKLFESCCESHDFQCECGDILMEDM